jgi:hypothetical protein
MARRGRFAEHFVPPGPRTLRSILQRSDGADGTSLAESFLCLPAEDHLWRALAYVERNPVRAGMVARAADYRWSSAAAHLTGQDASGILDPQSADNGREPLKSRAQRASRDRASARRPRTARVCQLAAVLKLLLMRIQEESVFKKQGSANPLISLPGMLSDYLSYGEMGSNRNPSMQAAKRSTLIASRNISFRA